MFPMNINQIVPLQLDFIMLGIMLIGIPLIAGKVCLVEIEEVRRGTAHSDTSFMIGLTAFLVIAFELLGLVFLAQQT